MTVLVDTGVLYADHDSDATRHDAARGTLEAVYDGEFGQPYVTEYVFDEAVTLARRGTDSHPAAIRLSDRIRGVDRYPQVYDLRQISTAVFTDAITVFERYEDQSLSFTDATSIALVERHDLDGILSFDDNFDGLVRRVDPASV